MDHRSERRRLIRRLVVGSRRFVLPRLVDRDGHEAGLDQRIQQGSEVFLGTGVAGDQQDDRCVRLGLRRGDQSREFSRA